MAPRSKSMQNRPLPAAIRLSNEAERKPRNYVGTPLDRCIAVDEETDHASTRSAGKRLPNISDESLREEACNYHRTVFEGRLTELAARIGYELNDPLAGVMAYTQLLIAREPADETTNGCLEAIYREAERATRVINNLLSFARRHKPEKSLISINEVVEKNLELHAYRMRVNNIEVVTELDPDLPKTMADFHQMQQVFVNIITNAEQAMTEAHGKGKFVIKTQRAGEMIQIAFTDDGPGISENNLKSIFDPFFTTKKVGKGTGLGLSICYGIVQQHGGHLYAESKLGEGTTFVVEVPIVSLDHPAEEIHSTHHLQSTSHY